MSLRLGISVEGQTEERFVKTVMAPHLARFSIHATPIIVATSRSADGSKAKGGGINVDRVSHEAALLLRGFGYVTTFYDFYGFDGRRPDDTADSLQQRIAERLGQPRRFIGYVQRYEFEGLLLSDPAIAARYFGADRLRPIIEAAVSKAGSPEDVNDGARTAPSKRLEAWTRDHAPPQSRYSKATKTLHGPRLAERLTLPVIRKACRRFDQWVSALERLSA